MIYRFICVFLLGMIAQAILFKIPPIDSNKYLKINYALPDLNRGGCGYFAYKLYTRLDKDRYDLVIIEKGKHIMIRDWWHDAFIDSKGYHTRVDVQINYGPKIESITEDSLGHLIHNNSFWNKTFCKEDTVVINNFIDNL